MMKGKKPHSDWAGYVAECRNTISGDYNVLVEADSAGLDAQGGRWAVICNAHSTILNHTNQRILRQFAFGEGGRGSLNWCDECRALADVPVSLSPTRKAAIAKRNARRSRELLRHAQCSDPSRMGR